jgi:hypothetical protein
MRINMKNKIIFIGFLAMLPLAVFGADNVIKPRKQGTAAVEREHAQQMEQVNVLVSENAVYADNVSTNSAIKAQNSTTATTNTSASTKINVDSKGGANFGLNQSQRPLLFNAPK